METGASNSARPSAQVPSLVSISLPKTHLAARCWLSTSELAQLKQLASLIGNLGREPAPKRESSQWQPIAKRL
jgi:hypothetical protein